MSSPPAAVALRRLRVHRTGAVVALGAVACVPFVPWVRANGFVVAWALTSALVGMSMNVLAGYAGQISLAHAVLFGSGAFALGNLVTHGGVPWPIALPAAGLITAVIALAIGFPALRIRGLHLAIATLGFQFVMQRLIFRIDAISGGSSGVDIERPSIFGVKLTDDHHFLWVILFALVVIWVLDRNLTRSKGGRAFFALRQDEQVAASFGIPVARYKLLAFAISGFYAGVAGGLFGTLQGDITNELFDFVFSIEFLVFAVLGGLGSRGGTAFGGAFPVLFRSVLSFLRFTGAMLGGFLLVATLLRYEGGVAAQIRETRDNAKALYHRGPIFFASFFGALTVTIASALLIPSGVWLLVSSIVPVPVVFAFVVGVATGAAIWTVLRRHLKVQEVPAIFATIAAAAGVFLLIWWLASGEYVITSFPLILFGLVSFVGVSLLFEHQLAHAAVAAPPSLAQATLIRALGGLGAMTVSFAAVFGLQFILSIPGVIASSMDPTPAAPIAVALGIALFAYLLRTFARDPLRASAPAVPGTSPAPAVEAEAMELAPTPKMNGAILSSSKRRDPYRGALLEVDDLAMHFGGVRALDGVALEVREGELIGIMGPNGSGKTTMLNCISGFLTPTRGQVRFRGRSILGVSPHGRAALGLGRTFQQVGLVKQETVFDNFVIAQHLGCRYGPMEGLIRTGAVLLEERRLRARAAAAIEMLGLGDIAHEQVRALPHGRAKLVELGCALVTEPELLLLDEPAAGVSPQEADALGDTLKHIAGAFGVTILMIEHHVPLMLSTCDYIYVLNFGRLLTHGEPLEVARHPDVIAAYLGTTGKEAGLAVTAGL